MMKRAEYDNLMESVHMSAEALKGSVAEHAAGNYDLADFTLEFVKTGVRIAELKLKVLQSEVDDE